MLPLHKNLGPLKGPWVIPLSFPYIYIYTYILYIIDFVERDLYIIPPPKKDDGNPYEPSFNVKMLQKWLIQPTPGPTAADWYSAPTMVKRVDLSESSLQVDVLYCWWFRNPKQPPDMYKTPVIMG